MIAFGPGDGRLDDLDVLTTQGNYGRLDTVDSELMGFGVADDAAFADPFAASLELWFYQDDSCCWKRARMILKGGSDDCGQDKRSRNERDIHR